MPAALAEKEFDRLAEPGAPHLERKHVQPDNERLKKVSTVIEQYATRRIAHLDQEEPSVIPTFPELNAALDEFERIIRRYKLLLEADGGQIVPVLMYPWRAVLHEPWIIPDED